MKEKILVTGGTGYIGSHTVVELQNAGYEVIIIDNLSNSSADVVDNIEKVSGIRPVFEKLDCLDYAGLDAVFTKYKGIKAIIHFAASKAVGESVEKPLLYYRNNLVSLINLLELMPKHGVEGIVFSSSCTVYGQPDHLPVTEEAPIKKAESPYGNTKQINEEIVRDTVASGAPINAILLRYFNPIGAHPTALLGELPNGVPQNLIPYLTQTAIGIREKLSVFGDDYDTPDGSCIRDFINVVDLAKAHVVAIRRILEKKQKEKVEVFNIGKRYKNRSVLRNVSLNVRRGEAVGLLGPNGAGKTTCFYCVTGLITPDYGDVHIDGQDITYMPMYKRARMGIGYLPQEASIFRNLSVEDNIKAVLEIVVDDKEKREVMLEELLNEFSIAHLRKSPSIALSGGERRRLEIARALAGQPHYILLDEPLAGIDPIAVGEIRELVSQLKNRGLGVLITDHNVRETLDIIDRAYILHGGAVLMEGTPAEIVASEEVRKVYLGDNFSI